MKIDEDPQNGNSDCNQLPRENKLFNIYIQMETYYPLKISSYKLRTVQNRIESNPESNGDGNGVKTDSVLYLLGIKVQPAHGPSFQNLANKVLPYLE